MKGKKNQEKLITFKESDFVENTDEEENPKTVELGVFTKVEAEKLEWHLSQCQLCGPTKPCKIVQNSNHIHYTFQMIQSHSTGLVS